MIRKERKPGVVTADGHASRLASIQLHSEVIDPHPFHYERFTDLGKRDLS